ncbi:MAG: glycosyltransferase [Proteobacteria bacterium]|nr:glycosyltransferase [Pseudomonadota bacterium]MCP4918208.1 glycosyltransferase [Pseudomonadota bacterium]
MSWSDPAFGAVLAGGWLALLTLVWVGLTLGVGRWGAAWRLRQRALERRVSVSICIPARNEEGRIGPAVRAALASDLQDLEIVVVDDRSEDGTAAEVAAIDDPRVRLVSGTEPGVGWAGKPWACMRAAGEARGELLLFIDADVELAPWAASSAVAELLERDLSMLSLFGDWRLESFWERAVIPVIGWFIRGAVDLDASNDPGRPEAFANGQFILVTREAYDRIGGHGAVRAEVLDDVRLARALKGRALRIGLLHGPGSFRVRLYESLGDIVSGYTKNLYEGMDRQPILALGAVLFVFVTTVLPYLLLAVAAFGGAALGWSLPDPGWILWLAGNCLLIHVFRWRLERTDGRSGVHALSHPIGNAVFVYILLRSMLGMEATWKGRRFHDGKAAGEAKEEKSPGQ